MIKELVKVAGKLDELGLTKEADFLDKMISKLANDWDDYGFHDEPTEIEPLESNPEYMERFGPQDDEIVYTDEYTTFQSDGGIDEGQWYVLDSNDDEVDAPEFKTEAEALAFIAGLKKAKEIK